MCTMRKRRRRRAKRAKKVSKNMADAERRRGAAKYRDRRPAAHHGENAGTMWNSGDWTFQTNGEAEHRRLSGVRSVSDVAAVQPRTLGEMWRPRPVPGCNVSTPTPQTHKRRGLLGELSHNPQALKLQSPLRTTLHSAQCRASSAHARQASSATGMRLRPFLSSRLLALPSLAALGFCIAASRAPMLFGRVPTLSRGMISRRARQPSSSTGTTSLTTLGGVLGSKLLRISRANDTGAFLIARDVLLPAL